MINWTSKNRFELGDTRFRCMQLGLGQQQSTPEEFVFQKSDWMVDRYQQLAQELQAKHIFELGIWRGGSCVFFHQLCNPAKLVFELVLACPSAQSYIEKIEIDRNSVIVWRGDAEISPADFSIQNCSLRRGRQLIAGDRAEAKY